MIINIFCSLGAIQLVLNDIGALISEQLEPTFSVKSGR